MGMRAFLETSCLELLRIPGEKWLKKVVFSPNIKMRSASRRRKIHRARDEMDAFARRNLASTGDWKSLGVVEGLEEYQTKDEKFVMYLSCLGSA